MLSMLLISALAVAQYPTPAEKPAAQDTTRARANQGAPAARDTTNQSRTPTTAAALKQDMRRLWSEHIALTHNYMVSAFAGLGDTTQLSQRLLRNQDEIGDAIKPFYGPAAGQQLATMLRGHIVHATHAVAALKGMQTAMGMPHQGQMHRAEKQQWDTTMNARPSIRGNDTTAARPTQGQRRDTTALARGQQQRGQQRAGQDTIGMRGVHGDSAGHMMGIGVAQRGTGDTTDVNKAVAMLRANADSIAAFLNSANPRHWPRATLQSALNMHLDLLVQAAKARARSDWSASVAALDASHRQAMQMADVLTDGIVKQFPNRFSTRTTAMSGQ